jgi:hypothetical protein
MEAVTLTADSEVSQTVVDLFADYNQVSAGGRVERICYSNFFRPNPCIMSPLRTTLPKTEPLWQALFKTGRLHGVDPQAYLTDILTRLANLWQNSWIDELLPWQGRPNAA